MADEVDITVSDDGLQAIAKLITPQTESADITRALEDAGVTHGISGEKIQNAMSATRKTNRPIGDVVVAEGTPAKTPVPPRIEPAEGSPLLKPLNAVLRILELHSPAEATDAIKETKVFTVKQGDLLGTLVVEEGEPGISVRGEKVEALAPAGEKPPTDPGPGTIKMGAEFRSKIYGFAGIYEGQAAVLPPFWLTEDRMTAAFINGFREEGSQIPTAGDLKESLREMGVTFGVDDDALDKLASALKQKSKLRPLIAVAHGEDPTDPQDASAEFSFPYQSQSGVVRADGSINLRERNTFPGVADGETIAQIVPSVEGKEGHTVLGDEIDVRTPVEIELVAGENVRQEGEKLVSEIDGGASVQTTTVSGDKGKTLQHTVSVRQVAQISGDVDYESGNLDFKGNVEIKGSVLSGFTVRATGNIQIGETVESGAEIVGGGDLVVRLGIVGETTLVRVAGDLTAKFIQDADVSADGDITVGSYIRSAQVSSRGTVKVEGGGGAVGGILGGEVWASDGVISKNVGSDHAYTTTISLGFDRESYAEYKKATRLSSRAEDLRNTLLKSIGITKLDPDEIKKAILARPRRKNEILRYVQKANDLAKAEEGHIKEAKSLRSKMRAAADKAHLDVSDTAYSKVTVRIGTEEKKLDANLKGVRFRLDSKRGVVATELSGDGEKKEG